MLEEVSMKDFESTHVLEEADAKASKPISVSVL